jgi:hypothetical protein
MPESDRAHENIGDEQELAALESALEQVPRGAIALASTAVGLMMICWFAIYLFIFLPRGSVG